MGAPAEEFGTLLEHAQQTLLKQSGVKLKETEDAMQQALVKNRALDAHIEMLVAMEQKVAASDREKCQALLITSRVTRSSAVLLNHFSNNSAISDLRPLVQKEIKALRAKGLKEGEVLHKTLLTKVRSILAMRG
eukprot:3562732-Amphidinium_carterae.1